jgi:hypothetical protein
MDDYEELYPPPRRAKKELAKRTKPPLFLLTLIKIFLYPPTDPPYIIVKSLPRVFGLTEGQVAWVFAELARQGFLEGPVLMPTDQTWHFPLPSDYKGSDMSYLLRKKARKRRWNKIRKHYAYRIRGVRHYVPYGKTLPRVHTDCVEWDGNQWVYCLHEQWWSSLTGEPVSPKKKQLNRIRSLIPPLPANWNGKGYKILAQSDPYVSFGRKWNLRMNPLDDDYATDLLERLAEKILDKHPKTVTCTRCDSVLHINGSRKKTFQKHRHKECDHTIVFDTMRE